MLYPILYYYKPLYDDDDDDDVDERIDNGTVYNISTTAAKAEGKMLSAIQIKSKMISPEVILQYTQI